MNYMNLYSVGGVSQSKKEARVVGVMIPNTSSLSPYPVRKMVQSEMSFLLLLIYLIYPSPPRAASGRGHEDQKRASTGTAAAKGRPRKCESVA